MRKIYFPIFVILFVVLTLSICLSDSVRTVTIFFISDEHGYLEPEQEGIKSYGGAANLMAVLRQKGYQPDTDRSILISGAFYWMTLVRERVRTERSVVIVAVRSGRSE